jgi:serine/threonine protein kinase/WD40 repeat protein
MASRLKQIQEIYQAALKLAPLERSVYVATACGQDADLRRAIETLLAEPEPETVSMIMDPTVAGVEIGQYRIEHKLGEGGMGAVYRAIDTKLNRPVAIKFLSLSVADAEARRRFQREAQMASSLNHPHIVTVHDAGEIDGRQYLVTEFVDGGTLKDWARRECPTWKQIVDLLTGVADGLAAAHQAGMVHRDVKPGNILVAKNGYAKLADFGLAKLTHGEAPGAPGQTKVGAIVGTLAYMSPEQALGRPLDARSDVFSFGIVLYEILEGKLPFSGKTEMELLKAIINTDPPPFTADMPESLKSVVDKALEKDPAERYQTVSELVVDLKRLGRKGMPEGKPDPERKALREPPPRTRRDTVVYAAAAVAIATLAIAGWLSLNRGSTPPNVLANAQTTRITDWGGSETEAAISRDGKFVVFRADRDGPEDTFVTQIGSGSFLNLTHGTQPHVLVRNTGFNPDASQVWLSSINNDVAPLRIVPFLGGTPRPFLTAHAMDLNWSPDGSKIVFQTYDDGDPVIIADGSGGNLKQIYISPDPRIHSHFPTWSKDGEWIYFVHGVWDSREMDVWRMRSSGESLEQLTNVRSDIRHLTVLDDRTLLYVAPDQSGLGPWLWQLDPREKMPRRISGGLEVYSSVDATADGKRLVASIANPSANLWTFSITDRIAEERDVKPFPVPNTRTSAPRYGGAALFYLASSGGAADGLWRYENGQSAEVWKGSDGALLVPPAISFDGRMVAIVFRQQGKRMLHTLSADGGAAQPLAESIDVSGSVSWSPDGTWIVVGGNDGSGPGLFKIPTAGGAAERLTTGAASDPVWSPDGSVIAYTVPVRGSQAVLKVVTAVGAPVGLPPIALRIGGERYRFIPGQRKLIYILGPVELRGGFWLLDLATKQTKQVSNFDGLPTRTFDISPDGKQIVLDRLKENSDVALIDIPSMR